MLVMGTNRWESDIPKDMLTMQALKFGEDVKSQGIAELQHFLLANEQKLLWCTWETDDLPALEAAFTVMNQQSGLISELTPVEDMYTK
ncbi:MAG: hypothetical protein GWP61_25950 [Chloroflexi bacterium]|jgi:hypothetical protein|nr:hypothetical protein [Chloroflexota bacterium]